MLTLKKQTALALGIANGLAAIHAAGVLHLDVKPANVLIVGDIPKLADFGSADLVIPGQTTARIQVADIIGTTVFMPPEFLATYVGLDDGLRPADEKVDVWSFACMVDWLQQRGGGNLNEFFVPPFLVPHVELIRRFEQRKLTAEGYKQFKQLVSVSF